MPTRKSYGGLINESGFINYRWYGSGRANRRPNEKTRSNIVKKFFKNKKVVGSLVTVILFALGVANPEFIGGVVTEGICAEVKCDA